MPSLWVHFYYKDPSLINFRCQYLMSEFIDIVSCAERVYMYVFIYTIIVFSYTRYHSYMNDIWLYHLDPFNI